MLKIVWCLRKLGIALAKHGIIDVLLELTPREIWLEKVKKWNVFWAFQDAIASKCHKNTILIILKKM